MLLRLLERPEFEAVGLYESHIEPRMWIFYWILIGAQIVWVSFVAPRELSLSTLQLLWWLGCGVSIASALAIQLSVDLPVTAWFLLLSIQLMDVSLLYWLSTSLLTPPAKRRRVIPGWR